MPKFEFKKKYGQNFLQNDIIANKIVDSINPTENDLILEIGPGAGAITKKLKKYNANLIAFEIDNDTEFEIFLTDLQKAYKQLGIDTDTHKVYTYNFMKQYVKTARDYALKGIEFLRIANKMTEYMQLKNAIENRTMTFLEIEKLINLHNSFLGEQL